MAKKTEDLRAYWQEIASKNGLDPNTIAAMDQVLGNETVARTFRQAFVPTPDHHSTVDTIKAEQEAYRAQIDEWYQNSALPAYQTNLSGIERLRQYESMYGSIDPETTTRQDARDLGFNSKAELDKILDDRFRAERAGYVGLSKSLPKMAIDYFKRFGKELDFDAVEQISVKKGLPPDLAYKEYITPEVEAMQKAEYEAKIKEAEERGARAALSQRHIPIDSSTKEFSPFFDRTAEAPAPASELEADRQSQSSFLEGWNSYAEQIANNNRSR